jgi:hypothetical protein
MRVFFDSWGQAWTPCEGSASGAEAFGPTGIARMLTDVEIVQHGLLMIEQHGLSIQQRSPWYAAHKSGRLLQARECHQWDELGPETAA